LVPTNQRWLLFTDIPDTQMKVVWISIQDHKYGGMARELERTGIKNGDEVSFPARCAGRVLAACFKWLQFQQFIDFVGHRTTVCEYAGRFFGLSLHH
jgi:hypothetical protein